MFRVMGVITSDRKPFQIPIFCVLRLRRYVCVCGGGGGGGAEVKIGLLLFVNFSKWLT